MMTGRLCRARASAPGMMTEFATYKSKLYCFIYAMGDIPIEAEWRIKAASDRSSLVEMVVCRLSGGKPLFKPMIGLLAYTAFGEYFDYIDFRISSESGGYFCLGLNVLTHADMWDQFSEPVTDNLTRVDEIN